MKIHYIMTMSVILVSVTACSLSKKKGDYAQVSETYSNTPPVFVPNESAPKKTKDDFGVLAITQDGPGYEINLSLDTGDENVNFKMDLPEQSSASKTLAEQDNNESSATDTQPMTNDSDTAEKIKPQPAQDARINDPIDKAEPVNPAPQVNNDTQTQASTAVDAQAAIVQTGPSSNDYLVSAQTQFYEDNYIGALTDIENAIKQDDTQALSYAIKGSILYKLGNKQAAKLAWEKALSLNPKLTSVALSLQYLVGQ